MTTLNLDIPENYARMMGQTKMLFVWMLNEQDAVGHVGRIVDYDRVPDAERNVMPKPYRTSSMEFATFSTGRDAIVFAFEQAAKYGFEVDVFPSAQGSLAEAEAILKARRAE